MEYLIQKYKKLWFIEIMLEFININIVPVSYFLFPPSPNNLTDDKMTEKSLEL